MFIYKGKRIGHFLLALKKLYFQRKIMKSQFFGGQKWERFYGSLVIPLTMG